MTKHPKLARLEEGQDYLPLSDYGLIGDGGTAALVGRDGSIPWLCLPRFDAPPLFCALLDHARGGAFSIRPDGLRASRQAYLPETAVLVTEMETTGGVVTVTDLMGLRAGAHLSEDAPARRNELLRHIKVLRGKVRLHIGFHPRGGARAEPHADGLDFYCVRFPDLDLHLSASFPLFGLDTYLDLEEGEEAHLLLRWGSGVHAYRGPSPEQLEKQTVEAWRAWVSHVRYDGPERDLVKRAAITLKLMQYLESGAFIAAPTSSIPEAIGGVRNWDYRYTWIRDASYSVYAMRAIGLEEEAWSFLGFVLSAVQQRRRPLVLYTVTAKDAPYEIEDNELEGYRQSRPVRWGNSAVLQQQNDVYGEILDCAWMYAAARDRMPAGLWHDLQTFVSGAARYWRVPDQGIWEVRTPGRVFTYSAALCHVALERAARLAKRFDLPGQAEEWQATQQEILDAIVEESWDERRACFTEHLGGGGGLDASLLSLPLRRVLPATHPRMVSTTAAIADRLSAGNGLLYRYRREDSPDGLPGDEGAFLLCSFWLVENYLRQGRADEAHALFSSLCARANPLGMLPEQIDPASGAFLGNYPQAFTHVGLISAAVHLSRAERNAMRGKQAVPTPSTRRQPDRARSA